jgi:hypothetical protein
MAITTKLQELDENIDQARAGLAEAVEADDSEEVVVWHKVLTRYLVMRDTGCTYEEAARDPWIGLRQNF